MVMKNPFGALISMSVHTRTNTPKACVYKERSGQEVHVEANVFPLQHQQRQGPVSVSSQRDLGRFQLFFFGSLIFSYWAIHLLTFCFVWGKCMSEINWVFQAACSSSLLLVIFAGGGFYFHSTAGLCSVFGVCSAFIRCLLMLYPHCIWSRVHYSCQSCLKH